jgi:hypothetical protein
MGLIPELQVGGNSHRLGAVTSTGRAVRYEWVGSSGIVQVRGDTLFPVAQGQGILRAIADGDANFAADTVSQNVVVNNQILVARGPNAQGIQLNLRPDAQGLRFDLQLDPSLASTLGLQATLHIVDASGQTWHTSSFEGRAQTWTTRWNPTQGLHSRQWIALIEGQTPTGRPFQIRQVFRFHGL